MSEVATLVQGTKGIVDSPYMDALHGAGYGVGRGTVVTPRNLNDPNLAGSIVNDSDIQTSLANQFGGDKADPNRLYIVFTPPNVTFRGVATDGSKWASSPTDPWATNLMTGWNNVFVNGSTLIHYVVIPYPGGTNASANGATDKVGLLDATTESLSHEIAEAVTGLQIGDSTGRFHVRMSNGVAVQEVGSPNDWSKPIPLPNSTPLPN
jgi:hypothetical protein